MDLRIELDKLLKKYGVNVYLQRTTNRFNKDEEEPKYTNKMEKHTVRSMSAVRSRGLGADVEQADEGLNYPGDFVFWFRWDAKPGTNDRIYVNDPNTPNDQIVYLVSWADPKYGIYGRIEFWAVGTVREEPN